MRVSWFSILIAACVLLSLSMTAGAPFLPRNRRERGIVVGVIFFLVVLLGAIVWMWHYSGVF